MLSPNTTSTPREHGVDRLQRLPAMGQHLALVTGKMIASSSPSLSSSNRVPETETETTSFGKDDHNNNNKGGGGGEKENIMDARIRALIAAILQPHLASANKSKSKSKSRQGTQTTYDDLIMEALHEHVNAVADVAASPLPLLKHHCNPLTVHTFETLAEMEQKLTVPVHHLVVLLRYNNDNNENENDHDHDHASNHNKDKDKDATNNIENDEDDHDYPHNKNHYRDFLDLPEERVTFVQLRSNHLFQPPFSTHVMRKKRKMQRTNNEEKNDDHNNHDIHNNNDNHETRIYDPPDPYPRLHDDSPFTYPPLHAHVLQWQIFDTESLDMIARIIRKKTAVLASSPSALLLLTSISMRT